MFIMLRTMMPLKVEAVVPEHKLSVYRVSMQSQAKNISCVNDYAIALYIFDQNDTYNDQGLLDVGHVMDLGRSKFKG
jgi:hypothetical protein